MGSVTRPRPHATADRCRTCGAPTITASRDVLGDVIVDAVADPTPLDPAHAALCVVTGRRTWRYGVEAGQGWLGDGRVTDRAHPAPDDLLPAHECGRPLPLPLAAWWARLDGTTRNSNYEEEPTW